MPRIKCLSHRLPNVVVAADVQNLNSALESQSHHRTICLRLAWIHGQHVHDAKKSTSNNACDTGISASFAMSDMASKKKRNENEWPHERTKLR